MSDDLLRLEEDPTLPESSGWRPKTLADVDWALARIAELERLIRENDELRHEAHARIEARTEVANAKLLKGLDYFRSQVVGFAVFNKDGLLVGKTKTRHLPNGSISFRKRGGKLVVEDATALAEWAMGEEAETGIVLTRQKLEVTPDLAAVRDYAATAREGGLLIPPGCRWEDETEAVVVKATGSEILEAEGD